MAGPVLQFGPFRLDAGARLLLRDGEPVSITPKVFDTLVFLVANAGRTVSREELNKAVWPDTFVEEGNLNYNMSQLRKILGEREPDVPYVQTIPKVGYRFVADIGQGSAIENARLRHKPRLGWIMIGVGLLVLAGVWWTWSARSQPTSHVNLHQLTHDDAETEFPALSPAGGVVAYMSDRAGPGRSDIWVQQTAGGSPLRLTKGPVANRFPAFSADGSKVYFSTLGEGAPQGIYEVSALGGQPQLLAEGGFWPRASPDGRSIAYICFPSFELCVIPVSGGPPRTLTHGYSLWTQFGGDQPLWSPDSRLICFFGQKVGQPQSIDSWVVAAEGGIPEKTGWNQWAQKHQMTAGAVNAWLPGEVIVFWVQAGDSSQIYRVPFNRRNWQILTEPEQLTLGTETGDKWLSVASGKVAFQSSAFASAVWTLSADTNQGRLTGTLQRLTSENALHADAYVPPDGKRLVFSSRRGKNFDIYLRDMANGAERVLVADREEKWCPLISGDGSTVLYTTHSLSSNPWAVSVIRSAGGSPRKLCDDCGPTHSLSPDAKWFLAARTDGPRKHINAVEVESGRSAVVLQHSHYSIFEPRFSPDGKWIAFTMRQNVGAQLIVAPFRGAALIPEQEWIILAAVSGLPGLTDLFWSPNGELVYFVSFVPGQRYLMAQRIDRKHHPAGGPFRVYEFSSRVFPRDVSESAQGTDRFNAVGGGFVGTAREFTSNIWLMELSR